MKSRVPNSLAFGTPALVEASDRIIVRNRGAGM